MIEVIIKKQQGDFFLDVDFASESKGVTVIAGPSGSGKSSIINMISGLSKPDSGYIRINGRTLYDSANMVNMPVQERRCGYVFQDGRLFPHMSVLKNLMYGHTKGKITLEPVAEMLGISHLLNRMPGKLSGGEKQRVAIGRALLMNPDVLLMDEPLASLDPQRKDELIPYIGRLYENFNIPVIYVTHSRREILRLADTLVRMKNGKVQSCGKAEGEFMGLGAGTNGDSDYVNVLKCYVKGFDDEFCILNLTSLKHELYMAADEQPVCKEVRAGVKASDIFISKEKPENVSTRNIIETSICCIENFDTTTMLVHTISPNGLKLTAKITRAAINRMDLQENQNVYLLIKSVSLDF